MFTTLNTCINMILSSNTPQYKTNRSGSDVLTPELGKVNFKIFVSANNNNSQNIYTRVILCWIL